MHKVSNFPPVKAFWPESLFIMAQMRSLLSPIPLSFVFLWSTGFIVARYGLPYAPPLTFLLLRFLGVLAILGPAVWLLRAPWPKGKAGHVAVAGLLLQAGYLSGVWCAIKAGMPAGLSALVVGMQPILTAFAAPLIGERVRPRQWLGLAFGLGGVALVVYAKVTLVGLAWQAIALAVFALLSITAGTLYQKHFCPQFDLRSGTVIQFAASFAAVLPFALLLEDVRSIQWTPPFLAAWAWSVLALSIGAIFLLFALIRRRDATQVTSLLYLTPPTTALMAWAMFGEVLDWMGIGGMALAVIGVIFVVKQPK